MVSEVARNVEQIQVDILGVDRQLFNSRLPVATGASFNSFEEQHSPACLDNTRVELLGQIYEWASDPGAEALFWLNGMAGTGKSTISRTVCQKLFESGSLASSFFFKRSEMDRGNAAKFITSMASQLAELQPSTVPHIKSAIEADPTISGKAMGGQFTQLIHEPLKQVSSSSQKRLPVVIVVDALDECDKEEDVKLIIRLFSNAKDIHPYLRILLTSRPELPIRLGFKGAKDAYRGLILHEIPYAIVERDITTYLESELRRIKVEYNSDLPIDRHLPPEWPGKENTQSLVKIAIPLFIFASTICRYLADRKCGNPQKQLQRVLESQEDNPASQLDATYLPILKRLTEGLSPKQAAKAMDRFRHIVGSIVVLANPQSAATLAKILDVSLDDVDDQLDLLHSVLHIPPSNLLPIKLLHLSFRDFLVDPETQSTNHFWVNEKATHEHLAECCLRVMNHHLHTDICQLVQPGTYRSSIDPLTIQRCIPPEVQYACLFWVYHIQQAEIQVDDSSEVYSFLHTHILHWIEVLSLIGSDGEGLKWIKVLLSVLDVSTPIH